MKRNKIVGYITALIIIICGTYVLLNAPRKHSWNYEDSFGLCNGYSYKLITNIPSGAILSAKKFLSKSQPIIILGNVSEISPKLESTTPHLCKDSFDTLEIPKHQERPNLKKINGRTYYFGVVPPGATRALLIATSHAPKISDYSGTDLSILEGLKNNPYSTSNVVVAYYPKKGWVGVYDDPASYGGFHK